jgi:hypothetical protein
MNTAFKAKDSSSLKAVEDEVKLIFDDKDTGWKNTCRKKSEARSD